MSKLQGLTAFLTGTNTSPATGQPIVPNQSIIFPGTVDISYDSGNFTLLGGSVYRLTATIGRVTSSLGILGTYIVSFWDVTNNVALGLPSLVNNLGLTSMNVNNSAEATFDLTSVTTPTVVQFRVLAIPVAQTITLGGNSAGNNISVMINIISVG